MKRKDRMSILVSSVLLIMLLSGCSSSNANGQKMGNTNANIANGGMSVMEDDWIYFMNYGENNSLFRIKTDGTDEEKLSDDMAYSLNYFGDWIYYCNGSDNNRIYKIKPDGKERTMVIDNIAQNIIVADGWIYYINHTDGTNTKEYRRIFRIKTDGKSRQQVNVQDTLVFNVEDDGIYYVNNNDQKIYRINADGSGDIKLSDSAVSSLSILEGYIYYIDSTDGNNRIWRMKLDGTEAVMLTEDKASAFNPSGEWIYYGNTLNDTVGFEMKKMKLDGTEATVMNDDSPAQINVHDDMLVYTSMDFSNLLDFSIKQTIVRTDGTGRKDYAFVPPPPESITEGVEIYKMNDAVKLGDMTFTVISAYATNIIENNDSGSESQIFDDVVDGTYLFINMTISNDSDNAIDTENLIGRFNIEEESGFSVFWDPMVDITGKMEKGDIRFHLEREAYYIGLLINPKETKDVQIWCTLDEVDYPVKLGLFNGIDLEPLAAIEVAPVEDRYVTGWNQSLNIIEARFPTSEVVQLNGMGFKFEGVEVEEMYYTFKVKEQGSSEEKYFLVKRDTGEIYLGAYDEKYPDYKAVPVKPLD